MLLHNMLADKSSISIRRVPARSPIRTPARKSVVGSPRIKPSLHPVEPLVQHAIGLLKSAEKTQENVGSTYADQMARVKSKISSDHAPPKPDGVVSPKTSPAKSAVPPSQTLGDSRYIPAEKELMIVGPRNRLRLVPQPRQLKEAGIFPCRTF